jgi:hypothetical protein
MGNDRYEAQKNPDKTGLNRLLGSCPMRVIGMLGHGTLAQSGLKDPTDCPDDIADMPPQTNQPK